MRHRKFSQRLSRPQGARRAALRGLVISLLKYQKIKTTKAKAHLAQSLAERLITLGRKNTLAARRQAYRILDDRDTVRKLFSQLAPLFKERTSGFSRIIHYSRRRGDGTELVFLELTEKLSTVKPKEVKKGKPAQEPAPSEKVERTKPRLSEAKPQEKPKFPKERPAKELKPKKFLGGLRRLFKKERDSL